MWYLFFHQNHNYFMYVLIAVNAWIYSIGNFFAFYSFEQSLKDSCVFRLVEVGSVSIIAAVHVDDIFAVGRKERCDRFCEDLNPLLIVPINNLGELRWHASCHYSRDKVAGLLTM